MAGCISVNICHARWNPERDNNLEGGSCIATKQSGDTPRRRLDVPPVSADAGSTGKATRRSKIDTMSR